MNTTATISPDMAALQNKFRANRAAILACESGDYTLLIPNIDLVPEHDRFARIREALQALTRENLSIIHQMQTSTTGPRKKTASPAEKAKAMTESKAKAESLLGDLGL